MTVRRYLSIVVAAACLAFAATIQADASTLAVHADFLDNGVIDQPHSIDDLKAALAAADGDPQYADLAAAITKTLDQNLLGRGDTNTPPPTPTHTVVDRLGVLPTPRMIATNGRPPLVLLTLTGLGGLLIVGGIGSSIYRRTQRPR